MPLTQKVVHDYEKLREILSNRSMLVCFIVLFLIVTLLYFVLTGILLVNPIEVNSSLSGLNVGLTISISGLTTLIIVITWNRMRTTSRVNSPKSSIVGSAAGLFASSCPVCQPIWLLWLGLGPASAFLIEYNTIIAVFGIGILFFSLHRALADPIHCTIPNKK